MEIRRIVTFGIHIGWYGAVTRRLGGNDMAGFLLDWG
jgi:hypothetical protein